MRADPFALAFVPAPPLRTEPAQREPLWRSLPHAYVAGWPIAALDRAATAEVILHAARESARSAERSRPLVFAAANGEALSRIEADPDVAELFADADLISADGMPLVFASRLGSGPVLPERVATTDLFHDVAARAAARGQTFYMLGATPEENARAVARMRRLYPALRIVGHAHGFHAGAALDRVIDEINALSPDVLWLGLGLSVQARFLREHRQDLAKVGAIVLCGGLFNFLSGTRRRAPVWMQRAGLEWLFRLSLEPRRLFWRYAVTNPHAAWLLLTRARLRGNPRARPTGA